MIKLSLKLIILLLSINTFLNAQSLLKLNISSGRVYEYCIEDNHYINGNKFWFTRADSGSQSYFELDNTNITSYEVLENYIYVDNTCILDESNSGSEHTVDTTLPLTHENLTALGLTEEDLHYMFALSGITTSFLFLFGLFRWI